MSSWTLHISTCTSAWARDTYYLGTLWIPGGEKGLPVRHGLLEHFDTREDVASCAIDLFREMASYGDALYLNGLWMKDKCLAELVDPAKG